MFWHSLSKRPPFVFTKTPCCIWPEFSNSSSPPEKLVFSKNTPLDSLKKPCPAPLRRPPTGCSVGALECQNLTGLLASPSAGWIKLNICHSASVPIPGLFWWLHPSPLCCLENPRRWEAWEISFSSEKLFANISIKLICMHSRPRMVKLSSSYLMHN